MQEPEDSRETGEHPSRSRKPADRAARERETHPSSFAGGRYQVIRLAGEGGQKDVYLARDTVDGREVVLSLLKLSRLDSTGVARARREAEAMRRLGDHPHIVAILDSGEEEGQPYIVCEYVEGGSVADLVHDAPEHRLPLEQALRIAEQVSQALEHAHARGIVHRDLKPANVWLTREGSVKLGDFGLALGLEFSRVTMEGVAIGTVAYMSPEQALGRQAEPRSDLYSLGVMLYEMATGRLPFVGDNAVPILSQHLNTPPVAPSWYNPGVAPGLENLILWLLSKVPDERPESATAVREALLAILSPPPQGTTEQVAPRELRSLARLAGGVFVGRDKELTALRSALHEARSGRGRLVMLVGEPGSGKTETAAQLVTYARLVEAETLQAQCYEGEGAPAYWPWLQVLRAYARERDAETLRPLMGPGAADIAQLVPEVAERFPELPPPPALAPEQARFRLFDSINTFLKQAARLRPLVLILDDLHWADRSSLLLLEFLAREMPDARLLVVGTYRDVELGRQHPLAQTLGELSRLGLSERIVLRGLTDRQVARFIEMTTGLPAPAELVAAIYQETEGNPFFVNEVVRLMVAEGRLDRPEDAKKWSIPIPQGVKEVLGRRLNQLSESANQTLAIASVLGREFRLEVLEQLSDLNGDRLVEALEEAVAARLIYEGPRKYVFSHALVRETLYGELPAARRLRLHRRIGAVLEKLYGAKPDTLPELAYHFYQAAPGGDVAKAIHYAVRAAAAARGLLAYDEEMAHCERALQALELHSDADPARRTELLLGLGEAQTRAGGAAAARESFEKGAELARKQGAAGQLARAALGLGAGGTGVRFGQVDEMRIGLLRESLGLLGEEESALRSQLMAQLSLALYYSADERRAWSQRAVEMARSVADKGAQIGALYSRCFSLDGFPSTRERLAAATDIVALASEAGDNEMLARAHYRRFRELLELGQVTAADQTLEAYVGLADALRQPLYQWLAPFGRANRALMEGRFEECEPLLQESLAIGKRAQDQNALLFSHTANVTLRRLQGRPEEIVQGVEGFVEKYPAIPAWRATLAQIYCELGRSDDARREVERLAERDFADLPRDGAWVVGVSLLAQTCAFLGDVKRAETLYTLLAPFAGYNVVVGSAGVFYGPVDRHLALLAATLLRWEEAARHFEDALTAAREMQARPFEAFHQQEYGTMLLARGLAEDRQKALELLDAALSTGQELGMKKLVEAALAARGDLNS